MSGAAIFARINSRERRRRCPSYVNDLVSKAQKNVIRTGSLVYPDLEECDIEEVHSRVLQEIRARKQKIPELTARRAILEANLVTIRTVIDRKYQLKLIENVDDQIRELETDNTEERYLKLVTPLLIQYQREKRIPRVVSFDESEKPGTDCTPLSTKSIVANKILSLAEEFVEIKIIKPRVYKESCHDCNQELGDVDVTTGTRICSNCGYEYSTITKSGDSYNTDAAAIVTFATTSSSSEGYDDRENFEKAIDRFQGKQPDKLPADIEDRLDGYFLSVGLPIGRYIRENRKLNTSGRREGTSRKMLHEALRSLELRDHYPDINLIGKKYWGWRLTDLSIYKDRLMRDYDRSQAVYETIPKERKSSLNTDYRLMKHLQLLHVPCSAEDFKMIKTRKILLEYERIWKIICNRCGWAVIKTI